MIIKRADFLDDRGRRLIGKYLLGGAAAGGSAALATSLVNYYRMLQEEAKKEYDTSKDDDTLYINLGKSPGAEKVATVAGGLAITGGSLAALGTYAAVRKLYQKYKKQRLQAQLDEAQQGYFDELTVPKEASFGSGKPMSPSEFVTSVPVSLTLLAAIASGALTHKALNKYFPAPKTHNPVKPKRIVIKKQDDPDYYNSIEEDDLEEKAASYDARDEYSAYTDGLEFLVHMCLGHEKTASVSDLANIVGAVIDGRKDELVENIMELGSESAFNTIKGAYEKVASSDPATVSLAVSRCVHSPELRPSIELLAAAEYNDIAPHFCKAASDQPEHIQDILLKIAGTLGAFGRSHTFGEADITIKEASLMAPPASLEDILALIESAENGELEGDADENPEDQQTLLSTDSEGSSEYMREENADNPEEEKPKVVKRKAVAVEADPKDEIDMALSGGM